MIIVYFILFGLTTESTLYYEPVALNFMKGGNTLWIKE